MPRIQFSLRHLFVLTFLVAAAVAGVELLISEEMLLGVWLATLLFSGRMFCRSVRGWTKVMQMTAITGSVWMFSILGTHLMHAGMQGMTRVLSRAAAVIVVGIAAAFIAACLFVKLEAAVARWRAGSPQQRLGAAAALLAIVALAATAWSFANQRYWQPRVSRRSAMPSLADDLSQIRVQHPYAEQFEYSCDGRLLAIAFRQRILVREPSTGRLVARLAIAAEEEIASCTFSRDATAMAAIVQQQDSSRALVKWQLADGLSPQPVFPDTTLDSWDGETAHPALVDHSLLLVRVSGHRVDGRGGLLWFSESGSQTADPQVEIELVDWDRERVLPRRFPALGRAIADHLNTASDRGLCLLVSPNQQWIVANPDESGFWVFGPQDTPPRPLPGWQPPRFLPDGDRLVTFESREWLVWKSRWRARQIEPPFWRHIGFADQHRVSVFDCRQDRVVLRSKWHRAGSPQLTPDRRRVTANQRSRRLTWEIP